MYLNHLEMLDSLVGFKTFLFFFSILTSAVFWKWNRRALYLNDVRNTPKYQSYQGTTGTNL